MKTSKLRKDPRTHVFEKTIFKFHRARLFYSNAVFSIGSILYRKYETIADIQVCKRGGRLPFLLCHLGSGLQDRWRSKRKCPIHA